MNGNTEQISTPPSLHFDLGEMGAGGGGTDTRLLPGLCCCLLRKGERMVRLWVSPSALLLLPQKYLFWVQKEPSAIWRDPPLIKSFKGLN